MLSSEDDFIIDVLDNFSKNNERTRERNETLPIDASLRTHAQENELGDANELLTDDQATNGESNDKSQVADVETVIERHDENLQSTSISQEIPQRTLNFVGPYIDMPPPSVELDGVKKNKSPLKQFWSRSSKIPSIPSRYGKIYTHKIEEIEVNEPFIYSEPTESSDKDLWFEATKAESKALVDNELLTLVK